LLHSCITRFSKNNLVSIRQWLQWFVTWKSRLDVHYWNAFQFVNDYNDLLPRQWKCVRKRKEFQFVNDYNDLLLCKCHNVRYLWQEFQFVNDYNDLLLDEEKPVGTHEMFQFVNDYNDLLPKIRYSVQIESGVSIRQWLQWFVTHIKAIFMQITQEVSIRQWLSRFHFVHRDKQWFVTKV